MKILKTHKRGVGLQQHLRRNSLFHCLTVFFCERTVSTDFRVTLPNNNAHRCRKALLQKIFCTVNVA